MGIYSLGSACILHLWGTEPNPGPVAITTTGTDHVCGLVVMQGHNRARVNAGLRLAVAMECCACRDAVAQGSAAAQATAALAEASVGSAAPQGQGLGHGARSVVESRARERRGQGTTLKWLTAWALNRGPRLGCWWRRALELRARVLGAEVAHGRGSEECEGVE